MNIPIRIERRDGSPISRSPPSHDENSESETGDSHGPHSMPSRHFGSPNIDRIRRTPSPKIRGPNVPPKPASRTSSINADGQREYEIPIRIETTPNMDNHRIRAPSWDSTRFMRKNPIPGQPFGVPKRPVSVVTENNNNACHGTAAEEPHVTRIPVHHETTITKNNNNNNLASKPPTHQNPVQQNQKAPEQPKDGLQLVQDVETEVSKLESQVNEFSGTYQDKQYRYLDEMLTRCMLKLDNIETLGRDDIRKARKACLVKIEKCLSYLEERSKNSVNSVTSESIDNNETENSKPYLETNIDSETFTNAEPVNNKTSCSEQPSDTPTNANENDAPSQNNQEANRMEVEALNNSSQTVVDSTSGQNDSQQPQKESPEASKDSSNILCSNNDSENNDLDKCIFRKKEIESEEMVEREPKKSALKMNKREPSKQASEMDDVDTGYMSCDETFDDSNDETSQKSDLSCQKSESMMDLQNPIEEKGGAQNMEIDKIPVPALT